MIYETEMIPLGHPNRPGTKLEGLLGIVVHYTGNDRAGADDDMNARYFGRGWSGTIQAPLESDGKTPFGYGSAHVVIDKDSSTLCIPLDEVAWGAGDDIWLPKDNGFKGQQPLATHIFGNRQNHFTLHVEICNNRDGDWDAAVRNAQDWIVAQLTERHCTVAFGWSLNPQSVYPGDLQPNEILIVRHFDLTGKICPEPFVDDTEAWRTFVNTVAKEVMA